MATTNRFRAKVHDAALAARTLVWLYNNPAADKADGDKPWGTVDVEVKNHLDYNGEDMHHRVLVHSHTVAGTAEDPTDANAVIVYASASDDAAHFVEIGRYDGNSNTDAILVTGQLNQAPFKYVAVEVIGATAKIDIESWGTRVR